MTNPNGLVLDMFQFTDEERFLELNADGRAQLLAGARGRRVRARRRRGPAARAASRACCTAAASSAFAPVIHCDNDSSRRYTILDIIASNALGLLHRISRVMSQSRLRRRSRADCHRRREGDRRVSHHRRRRQAVARRSRRR